MDLDCQAFGTPLTPLTCSRVSFCTFHSTRQGRQCQNFHSYRIRRLCQNHWCKSRLPSLHSMARAGRVTQGRGVPNVMHSSWIASHNCTWWRGSWAGLVSDGLYSRGGHTAPHCSTTRQQEESFTARKSPESVCREIRCQSKGKKGRTAVSEAHQCSCRTGARRA